MDIQIDGTRLVLAGDLDVRSTWEVRNALQEQIFGHDRDILVDLSGVHTADIVALRMLAFATRQAARQGRHVTLRGCCPAVRRLLHISRLIRVLEVERVAATA